MNIAEQLKIYVSKILSSLGLIASEDEQLHYQVINITVPNPTAANTLVETSVQLDRDYNRVVGIGFFEKEAGGLSGNYNVGARSSRLTWIDDIDFDAWAAASGVSPRQKYYPVNIPYGSGDTFYGRVTPGANTSAAFSAQMVLILKKDLTQLPK